MVRFAERRQRLTHHVHDAAERERAFLVGDAREVAAAEELHHQVQLAVLRLAEVDDADGVGVVQAARGAGFGDEGARRQFSSPTRWGVDDLDGDGAPEVRLLRPIDAPHPADPDELEDDVPAGERLAEQRVVGVGRHLADGEPARRAELVLVVALVSALRARSHRMSSQGYHAEPGTESWAWMARGRRGRGAFEAHTVSGHMGCPLFQGAM